MPNHHRRKAGAKKPERERRRRRNDAAEGIAHKQTGRDQDRDDRAPRECPHDVVARADEGDRTKGCRAEPRAAIEAAVHRAVRNAVFLFCLVFKVNEQALEIARVEGLRATAVFFWMSALLGGPRADES